MAVTASECCAAQIPGIDRKEFKPYFTLRKSTITLLWKQWITIARGDTSLTCRRELIIRFRGVSLWQRCSRNNISLEGHNGGRFEWGGLEKLWRACRVAPIEIAGRGARVRWRRKNTAFPSYPGKKLTVLSRHRVSSLKSFLCSIVARPPINAFPRVSKGTDSALQNGLKRAPFATAFYNIYKRGRVYTPPQNHTLTRTISRF